MAVTTPTDLPAAEPGAAHGVDSARSWVVLVAAFLAMFTVFGVAYSFGEFFRPMADEFGTNRSATAFFFSITTFAYFALGIFSGRIADRFGPRRVVVFGAVSMVIGLLLTAEVRLARKPGHATANHLCRLTLCSAHAARLCE